MERKVHGSDEPKKIECLNPVIPVYAIRWDIRPNTGHEGSSATGWAYMERQVWHKPSMDEIKETILDWHNKRIDREILQGMKWQENEVWLSTENQFNYKAAFDLAVMTEGTTLPVTFKFGTADAPTYHEFKTVEELTQFYTACMEYVQTVLKRGWMEKDAIDFAPYEIKEEGDSTTDAEPVTKTE